MVSVIIPVYNVKAYLADCLDSVVAQSFVDKEVILIDDGSTDGSGEICDDYASRYSDIRVIHKTNGGLSSARNCGIENAHGEWLIFLDSDDVWADSDCLATLYGYVTSLDLDIVRFEYQAVDDELKPIEPRSYDKSHVAGRVVGNYEFVKDGIAGEWFAVLYMLRTSVVADLRFNEQTKFQEDIDFYCRLFARRELRCGYIDRRMYLYRKRTASITMTARVSNLEGSFALCDVFYNESQKAGDSRLRKLYIYYSVMMYYWTLSTLSEAYYHKRRDIIEVLGLIELRKKTVKRLSQASVNKRYYPFILLTPDVAVRLLRAKNRIMIALKSL